jgi:arylsulfatase A-like enzyme
LPGTEQPGRPPNLLVLITDQQRRPRHWPDEPGWLGELMPNDAELARTGVSFTNAFCNTAMCSPSRATLFSGRYPAEHGVELTLTAADLRPDPRNLPGVMSAAAGALRAREAPARRVAVQFARGALGLDRSTGGETELPTSLPSLGGLLGELGYRVSYKGKWHLTHPSGGEGALLGGWSDRDAERLERDYALFDWEAPDAGENAKADHFGGGNAGEGEGWDEVYTQQTERWLRDAELREPFCLVVSLVNPHDVLGYPASYVAGGYDASEFRELGVELPSTVDETLRNKPAVHSLMRMGMAAYLGPLRDRRAQLDYVNFYAHLHRVVDRKIGRILGALGDPADPESLRSRTVIVRTADHGEMGLAHGGLRQKTFNAYEETINVPLVVSNPVLFPKPAQTDALASLVDVLPTLIDLAGGEQPAGLRGHRLTPLLAAAADAEREALLRSPVDLAPVLDATPAASVQDEIHFTYDDHQAGTATREAPGQPNRIRAIRTADAKYAVYFDPKGRAASEHEMYDLERDPNEWENLLEVGTGEPCRPGNAAAASELRERLDSLMERCGTEHDGLSGKAG